MLKTQAPRAWLRSPGTKPGVGSDATEPAGAAVAGAAVGAAALRSEAKRAANEATSAAALLVVASASVTAACCFVRACWDRCLLLVIYVQTYTRV